MTQVRNQDVSRGGVTLCQSEGTHKAHTKRGGGHGHPRTPSPLAIPQT